MTTPLKHPQEIELWYILPAIRRELVLALRERGLNQRAIAKLLNITEPAVSHYINEKRAKGITFNEEVNMVIKNSAEKITDNISAYQQIQQINNFIKQTKALCQVHMSVEGGLEGCDICYK